MLDWFTVTVQIISFLILVALLKYFFYGRILAVVDAREQAFARRNEEIAVREEEARNQLAVYQHKLEELEKNRQTRLAELKREMEITRKELLGTTRAEVETTRKKWLEAIRHEQAAFLHSLRGQVGVAACSLARLALQQIAGRELEGQIVEAFLSHVESLAQAERDSIQAAFNQGSQRLSVHSAFELDPPIRDRIVDALRRHLGARGEIDFIPRSSLICGIQVQTDGHCLGWELGEHLNRIEEKLQRALEEGMRDEG